jgi:hypothetical protein
MDNDPKIRIVGRRREPLEYGRGGLKAADNLLRLVTQVAGGQSLAPCGVYRFKTHEEADEWLMKMLTRPNRGHQR